MSILSAGSVVCAFFVTVGCTAQPPGSAGPGSGEEQDGEVFFQEKGGPPEGVQLMRLEYLLDCLAPKRTAFLDEENVVCRDETVFAILERRGDDFWIHQIIGEDRPAGAAKYPTRFDLKRPRSYLPVPYAAWEFGCQDVPRGVASCDYYTGTGANSCWSQNPRLRSRQQILSGVVIRKFEGRLQAAETFFRAEQQPCENALARCRQMPHDSCHVVEFGLFPNPMDAFREIF